MTTSLGVICDCGWFDKQPTEKQLRRSELEHRVHCKRRLHHFTTETYVSDSPSDATPDTDPLGVLERRCRP